LVLPEAIVVADMYYLCTFAEGLACERMVRGMHSEAVPALGSIIEGVVADEILAQLPTTL